MAGPALPKYVAFTSALTTKFVRPSGPASLLKFEGVDIFSWGVKHEILYSKSEPGKVHIKCVDTGKYWSWGLDSTSEDYIAAQKTIPLTDLSCNECTLVKYSCRTIGGVSVFKLSFLWNSEWHTIRKDSGEFLKSGKTKGSDIYQYFTIVDWEQEAHARQIVKITSGGASNGKRKQNPSGGASNGNPKQTTRGRASSGFVEVVEYQIVRRVVYKEVDL